MSQESTSLKPGRRLRVSLAAFAWVLSIVCQAEAAELPEVELRKSQVSITLPATLGPEVEKQITTRIARRLQQSPQYQSLVVNPKSRSGKSNYKLTGTVEMVGGACAVSLSILNLATHQPAMVRRQAASCSADSIVIAFEALAADLVSRQP